MPDIASPPAVLPPTAKPTVRPEGAPQASLGAWESPPGGPSLLQQRAGPAGHGIDFVYHPSTSECATTPTGACWGLRRWGPRLLALLWPPNWRCPSAPLFW